MCEISGLILFSKKTDLILFDVHVLICSFLIYSLKKNGYALDVKFPIKMKWKCFFIIDLSVNFGVCLILEYL